MKILWKFYEHLTLKKATFPQRVAVCRFCRESRCMDQWVPIINLPERWTLTSDKNVSRDEFYLHTKRGVNPDGHRLPSKDQIPKHCWFGGEENSWKKRGGKKPLLSVWDDVFKGWGGGKSRGWIFTGLFGVASVSLGNRDETARFLYHHTVEMALFCCFFSSFLSLNVTLAGHSTDGYYHVFVW